jgi:molecular chaperone GrpE
MSQEQQKEAETKEEPPVEDKNKKIEELTELLQRVQADYENYKKRNDRDQENYIKHGKAILMKRILPVLDTFDTALKQKHDEGMQRVYNQLIAALEVDGLHQIKAVGQKFDPYRHACLSEDCSDAQKGIILEEIQKGYLFGEFVLRHSLVKVSNGKKEAKDDNIKKDT